MVNRFARVQQIGLADNLVKFGKAHGGQQFAHFFCNEEEIIDDVFRRAGEALAQFGVLRGDTDGAGIEMAFAHHHTARRNQRRGREAKLVSPQKRADNHIAPGAQAAVNLHGDARAQIVQHQRLMGFGQPDFPRAAGMFDRGQRAGTRAALKTRNRDMVGARFRNACGNRADANLGDEFDRNIGFGIGVFEVVDQLRRSSIE